MKLSKAHEIAKRFGYELCERAVAMCDDGGEGGYTVADYLDITDKRGYINIRRADNIIDAGRAIRKSKYCNLCAASGDWADVKVAGNGKAYCARCKGAAA